MASARNSFWTALMIGAGVGACSSGGSSSGLPPDAGGAQGSGDASVTQSIEGFDLHVKEGSWWEYSRVLDGSYSGDTGSGKIHFTDTFVVKLGAATTIGGDPAFTLQTVTIASNAKPPFSLAWKYISFVDKRIRVSSDGATYSVLFDANTGLWPATSEGMVGDFPTKTGTRKATRQSGATVTWLVGESHSANGCDDVPPYGVICNGSGDVSNSAGEVYDPSIGLVRSYYSGSTSSTSGFSSTTSETKLVDSSVAGDRPAPAPTGDDGGVIGDGGTGNGCVDIPVPATASLQVIARAGNPPTPTGGALVDGFYQATSIDVYGTGAAPGTPTATFSGDLKIAGSSFQTAFNSSTMGIFYAKGSFSVSAPTVNVTYTCESGGAPAASFDYTVTGPNTIALTTPFSGYTTVTTYTR
jgi:hypothetical protein